MMAFSGVTSQCEERGFRGSAGTNFEIAIAVVPAETKDDRSLVNVPASSLSFSIASGSAIPESAKDCIRYLKFLPSGRRDPTCKTAI
jgi:hypothetical protein